MDKNNYWRTFIGDEEMCRLRKLADFLFSESDKRTAELLEKEKEFDQIEEGGDEWCGMTKKEAFGDYLGYEFHDSEQTDQILFRSLVMSIFAFIERDLKGLCNQLKETLGEKFSVDDMRGGSGLKASLTYLDKVLDGGFVKDDEDLKHCNKLRNALMHGDLKRSISEQKKMVNQFKNTSFTIVFHNDELQIEKETISELLIFADRVYS